jgi:hypothetical protein
MEKAKLTVRVPRDLVENAKRYAAENHTTLTNLIETYLRQLPGNHSLENAPTVEKLSGKLSSEVSTGDYQKHLDQKYG